MQILSFGASSKEVRSIQNACEKMSNPYYNQEYINLYSEEPYDKVFITNKYDGGKRTVKLNIVARDAKAGTVLKNGSKEECCRYFSKTSTLDYVVDAFDRLKDLIRRDR